LTHRPGLLAAHLRERGIDCELSASIRCITPDSVTLTNGRVLSAGRVVMTTGVRPAIALAEASGIPCARGIVVDGQLRSAVAGVSAIGECCEIAGQTWGWWPLVCSRRRFSLRVCSVRLRRTFTGRRAGCD
jgi:nitrite reductase (NADH) large subunit